MLPQFKDYVDQFGDKMQFAYRKGVSCTDPVLFLVHILLHIQIGKEQLHQEYYFLTFLVLSAQYCHIV